eukprot:2806996-Pleurochrysis_carterae.AAC.1
MRLPPPAATWAVDEKQAFEAIMKSIATDAHPYLLPTRHAEVRTPFCPRFSPRFSARSLRKLHHRSSPSICSRHCHMSTSRFDEYFWLLDGDSSHHIVVSTPASGVDRTQLNATAYEYPNTYLDPSLPQVLLPRSRVAVLRPFVPRGSLRDMLNAVTDVCLPHSAKYSQASAPTRRTRTCTRPRLPHAYMLTRCHVHLHRTRTRCRAH